MKNIKPVKPDLYLKVGGTWCSSITSASHAERAGINPCSLRRWRFGGGTRTQELQVESRIFLTVKPKFQGRPKSGSFARGWCRRGRNEIPHFCSKLLSFAPCALQGGGKRCFFCKRWFCLRDTRHFRHFHRFPASEERNPLFLWVECKSSFSPFFRQNHPLSVGDKNTVCQKHRFHNPDSRQANFCRVNFSGCLFPVAVAARLSTTPILQRFEQACVSLLHSARAKGRSGAALAHTWAPIQSPPECITITHALRSGPPATGLIISDKDPIPKSAEESAAKSAGKKGDCWGTAGNSAVSLIFLTKPSSQHCSQQPPPAVRLFPALFATLSSALFGIWAFSVL